MKIRNLVGISVSITAMLFWVACGGSSSTPAGDGTGEASLGSLSSVPSIDLSQYDNSDNASSNVAVLPSESVVKSVGKAMGEGMRDVGGSSRAGCEANMHKQEIFRMSQQVQLDKCYPKAMERAGFMPPIPTGIYAYYKIKPPAQSAGDRSKKCAGIPAERTEELAKCLAGDEGPGSGVMLMRIGNIGNELQVDMCEGAENAEVLVNESTYGASGSVYTAAVKRIGQWNGKVEKGAFSVSLDLGTTGKVTDEVATLGADSSLTASGQMSGGFGSGNIAFEYVGSDSSNKVSGAFGGSFIDPMTSTVSSFTGKTFARFGGSTRTGCAQYAFTGSMPGMKVTNMMPYDVTSSNRAQFLATLSAQLGIDINEGNYQTVVLCPNPNFDPDAFNAAVKPMVLGSAGGTCPEVTNTGVECFSISNVAQTGNYGEVTYTQLFTIIANSGSPYYTEVNAYNVSALSKSIGDIVHLRNWDCSGTFTLIDFGAMTEAQMAAAQAAMLPCQAIEEKARGNAGMGGYDCGEKQQSNTVNEMAAEGGGDTSFGAFGGKWSLHDGCEAFPSPIPGNVFISAVNPTEKKYCVGSAGTCLEFTVNSSNASAASLNYGGGVFINNMQYNGSDPTGLAITWAKEGADNCVANYLRVTTEFTPTEGNTGPAGEGMPAACTAAGLTTPAQCQQLCMKDTNPCGFTK